MLWNTSSRVTLLCRVSRAHWYLVVICFPGLHEPRFEAWTHSGSKASRSHSGTDESLDPGEARGAKSPSDDNNNNKAETPLTENHSDKVNAETGLFGFYEPTPLPSFSLSLYHDGACACFHVFRKGSRRIHQNSSTCSSGKKQHCHKDHFYLRCCFGLIILLVCL